jgi:hypothetical protein
MSLRNIQYDSRNTWERGRAATAVGRLGQGATWGLRNQLSLFNRQVGAQDLKDVDMDCLDLINRHGQLSPTALARRAGPHPATRTGILDRRAAREEVFARWNPRGDWPAHSLAVVAALATPELTVEIEATAAVPRQ